MFCPFLLTLKSLYDFGQGYLCKQTLGSAKGFLLYKAHFTSLFDVILNECNSLKPGVFPHPVYKGMKVLGSYPAVPHAPVQAQGPLYHRPRGSASLPGTAALCDIYTKLAEAAAVCVPREVDGR